MYGVCDTWCTGCEYLAKSGDAYCDYYSANNWACRRPCKAGQGCTERRRPKPEKLNRDWRLVNLEQKTKEAAERGFLPIPEKKKHERTGRPRGGRESQMTEPEYRAKINAQKNARADGDPQRQAEMKRLKDFRLANRMTQKSLARLLGVSGGTVSAWEAGIAGARWDLLERVGCPRPMIGGSNEGQENRRAV